MGKNVVPKCSFLISFFITICLGNEMAPAIIEGPTTSPIGCNKRVYTYRVTQSDSKGLSCTDTITVNACWGRCDSKEISDWKFPYKKSHHPVCVHSGRTKISVTLRNCDPDAGIEAQRYEYMEPLACTCQICSTVDTSCESPQALQKGNTIVRLVEDVEEDYSLMSEKN